MKPNYISASYSTSSKFQPKNSSKSPSHFQNKSADLSAEHNHPIPSSEYKPSIKKSNLGVFERLASKKLCSHDHGQCNHSKKKHNVKFFHDLRRLSKSLHCSPTDRNKKMINFSKLLDSSNFDLDIRKIESCMSIEKDEQNNILITDESNKNEAPEQLDFNSHKDYLIGKLCQKLRKVNKENRNLNKRVEKLENQHFELVKSHDQTFEKLETEIGSIVKENLSMKLDNPKELTQIKEVIILENPKEIEVKSEEKKNFSQKQERFQTERTETYEDLLYKIKTLENDRNRYYEQLMTVQKKNEIFFIENSELSKKNQKILADNDDLASKLRFFETSIKKKSSLIFKSASINESTIETDDEMLKYSSLPPNEAIVKEACRLINAKNPYEILIVIQNATKIQKFCQDICRKLLNETEVKSPQELEDYIIAFESFIEDKKYLESVYIRFKQDVLKAMIGEKEKYEPLTGIEILEMVEKLKLRNYHNFKFEEILTEIKKCFSLKFENEAQFLSFLNHLFLENEEIYRIAKKIKEMLNFNEEELDTKTILARALIYLENSIYCIQNTRKENVSLLNSHYRYYLDFS